MNEYAGPWRDEVRRLLVDHRISDERVQIVRFALLRWFSQHSADRPLYLLPRATSREDDSSMLTAEDMVSHLERFSDVGRSYVELFIAGGLTNPHLDLEEVLLILEDT